MDRTSCTSSGVKADLFEQIILDSFAHPSLVPHQINKKISRSRSLQSKERKEFADLLYDTLRWRRRIWGDIAPSQISYESVLLKLNECKSLIMNPPLPKWSTLTLEELSREM